jgi:hypothetical protein
VGNEASFFVRKTKSVIFCHETKDYVVTIVKST